MIDRRALVAALAATPLLAALPAVAQTNNRRRMLLNSGFSGAQSWFWLAEDNGHMARAGIVLDYAPGRGAFTAAPRLLAEGFDVAFGDIYSLVEAVAKAPAGRAADLPIAVHAMFNRSPNMIAVNAAGFIRTPRDLVGKSVIGHDHDVALETFPALAKAVGIDRSTVNAAPRDATMAAMLKDMLTGDVDGVFGYITTATAGAATAGIAPERVRFLRFADHLPDFYGHALMVRRGLLREDPRFVTALVAAVDRGLADAIADPDAGIAAVARRDPAIDRAIERDRLIGTLTDDMGHPEAARIGIGAVDRDRLQRSVALYAAAKPLPRTPALHEIYTDRFLPPLAVRVKRTTPAG